MQTESVSNRLKMIFQKKGRERPIERSHPKGILSGEKKGGLYRSSHRRNKKHLSKEEKSLHSSQDAFLPLGGGPSGKHVAHPCRGGRKKNGGASTFAHRRLASFSTREKHDGTHLRGEGQRLQYLEATAGGNAMSASKRRLWGRKPSAREGRKLIFLEHEKRKKSGQYSFTFSRGEKAVVHHDNSRNPGTLREKASLCQELRQEKKKRGEEKRGLRCDVLKRMGTSAKSKQ